MNEEKIDKLRYFSEVNICKTLDFSDRFLYIATSKAKINSINIIKKKVTENKCLSIKKIFITGIVNVSLLLCAFNYGKQTIIKNLAICFSSSIIPPSNICENSPIKLNLVIEDISTNIVNKNIVILGITFIIEYINHREGCEKNESSKC